MTVRLYNGCYGVTRAREVVGPFTAYMGEFFKVSGRLGVWACDGFHWLPTNEAEAMGICRQVFDRTIRAFPSRAKAEAWVNRKPWWRRFNEWRVKFESHGMPLWYYAVMSAISALLITIGITSCASAPVRPYNHSSRCELDGMHKHMDSTAQSGREKG